MYVWDTVSYTSFDDWIPTMVTVPKSTLHAAARLKGALLAGACEAKENRDVEARARICKALTFIDRLLFAARHKGTKGASRTNAQVVTSRLRMAWRGQWALLLDEALQDSGHSGEPLRRAAPSEQVDARAVEAYLSEGLISKALARALGNAVVDMSARAARELVDLFPAGAAPQTPPRQP